MDSLIHDFQERLEYSAMLSDEPSWIEFYRRLWPTMLSAVRIDKNSVWQKWGVDRMILLDNGRQFLIDEKKREKNYDDILVEEWSVGNYRNGVYVGQKIGWSLDGNKRCDFIAYTIVPLRKCYLLPFEIFRLACNVNIEEWKTLRDPKGKLNYPKDATNNGYVTRNCAVQWPVLRDAMSQQMHRRFSDGKELSLPAPEVIENGKQLIFAWGPT